MNPLALVIRRPAPAADRATARLVTVARALATSPVPYSSARGSGLMSSLAGGDDTAALSAMATEPVLFACVTHLATTVAANEWTLYRKAPSRRKENRVEVDTDHLARDLWEEPAEGVYDRQLFVETFEQHLELPGETYWVLGIENRLGAGVPTSIWPVRPDRMTLIPSRKRWVEGYIYRDPDGQKVPFSPEEVIHLRTPNPLDPYHGLGPVKALLTDLDSSRFAAEYNRSFFRNSAEPGGVIEVDEVLSDDDFRKLKARWDEQHQGTSNAHRVAIIEGGMKWVDRSYSMRDLQFVELRRASAEQVMLAYGLSKVLLGQTESVNRATAEAAEYVFGKYKLVPRLNRIRSVLNRRLLPRFAGGDTLEWDYISPVTGNTDTEIAERNSRVQAVVALAALGYDPAGLCEAFDLPVAAVSFAAPAPAAPAVPPGTDPGFAELANLVAAAAGLRARAVDVDHHPIAGALPPACGHHHHQRAIPVRPRAADDPPDLDPADLPDVTRLQRQFDRILGDLLDDWTKLEAAQKAALVAQVLAIAESGSLEDLADLWVDTDAAAAILAAAMTAAGAQAAEALVDEAADQGVLITPAGADRTSIDGVATVVAGLIATRLITSAAATAMRANGPGVTARQVADRVEQALADLSVDGPRRQLAGSITGAQNDARLATLRKAPEAAIYAAEVNDSNTCRNCRAVDGKWLGNSPSDLDAITDLYPGGAYGGYVDCLGRENCRGTITGIWRK